MPPIKSLVGYAIYAIDAIEKKHRPVSFFQENVSFEDEWNLKIDVSLFFSRKHPAIFEIENLNKLQRRQEALRYRYSRQSCQQQQKSRGPYREKHRYSSMTSQRSPCRRQRYGQ